MDMEFLDSEQLQGDSNEYYRSLQLMLQFEFFFYSFFISI